MLHEIISAIAYCQMMIKKVTITGHLLQNLVVHHIDEHGNEFHKYMRIRKMNHIIWGQW